MKSEEFSVFLLPFLYFNFMAKNNHNSANTALIPTWKTDLC